MIGMIGNQDRKTLNAPSISPEIIPAELKFNPPDAFTFDSPFTTFPNNINEKTQKSQSFVTGISNRNLVFFTSTPFGRLLRCLNYFINPLEFLVVTGYS
jgi:hypothetical protein